MTSISSFQAARGMLMYCFAIFAAAQAKMNIFLDLLTVIEGGSRETDA
jgi:hypothetical protein